MLHPGFPQQITCNIILCKLNYLLTCASYCMHLAFHASSLFPLHRSHVLSSFASTIICWLAPMMEALKCGTSLRWWKSQFYRMMKPNVSLWIAVVVVVAIVVLVDAVVVAVFVFIGSCWQIDWIFFSASFQQQCDFFALIAGSDWDSSKDYSTRLRLIFKAI